MVTFSEKLKKQLKETLAFRNQNIKKPIIIKVRTVYRWM
jgi:hypothetical protein